MWWMMLPSAPRETPIEEFPELARPAVLAARAMNANVAAAADLWQASVTAPARPPAMDTSAFTRTMMGAVPRAGAGLPSPFGMWPPMFMSVETRDGETRVAVGQKLPALPFLRLPRIEF